MIVRRQSEMHARESESARTTRFWVKRIGVVISRLQYPKRYVLLNLIENNRNYKTANRIRAVGRVYMTCPNKYQVQIYIFFKNKVFVSNVRARAVSGLFTESHRKRYYDDVSALSKLLENRHSPRGFVQLVTSARRIF